MTSPKERECEDCLAHYTGDHTCPPWLKEIVKMSKSKPQRDCCAACSHLAGAHISGTCLETDCYCARFYEKQEGICEDCTRNYPVWFAPNALWNKVCGVDGKNIGDISFLCMDCFAIRAEQKGVKPLAWKLEMEESWKEQVDAFVRDVTKIPPMPKSEVRARLKKIVDREREKAFQDGHGVFNQRDWCICDNPYPHTTCWTVAKPQEESKELLQEPEQRLMSVNIGLNEDGSLKAEDRGGKEEDFERDVVGKPPEEPTSDA